MTCALPVEWGGGIRGEGSENLHALAFRVRIKMYFILL